LPSRLHQAFSAAARRKFAGSIGAIGEGGPETVVRTPHDAAPVQAAVRRDAQHELVCNIIDVYAGDLGATVGKVAHDAGTGKTAIAIIYLGQRIPFDSKGLSTLVHDAVSAQIQLSHIEKRKCENGLNDHQRISGSLRDRYSGRRND
jgi:hypothetical protein